MDKVSELTKTFFFFFFLFFLLFFRPSSSTHSTAVDPLGMVRTRSLGAEIDSLRARLAELEDEMSSRVVGRVGKDEVWVTGKKVFFFFFFFFFLNLGDFFFFFFFFLLKLYFI
jgi:hypothetical protein